MARFRINDKLFNIIIIAFKYREHVQVCGQKIYGYTDLGDGPGKDLAAHALVFMATGVAASWKIPVGHSLSGKKRAELTLSVIEKIKETGAIITNLTCDNPPGINSIFLLYCLLYLP